jgi:hypothetical protein
MRIHRGLDPAGEIPREAVIGAWRVDGRGRIVGDFIVQVEAGRWPKRDPRAVSGSITGMKS